MGLFLWQAEYPWLTFNIVIKKRETIFVMIGSRSRDMLVSVCYYIITQVFIMFLSNILTASQS